ncbi:MAG: hypothetical protein F4094_09080 [Synechococcus sp. SB0672_bin_6]|nr:hypothetical protein [Synechococcus sp. SB0672_bin_6]
MDAGAEIENCNNSVYTLLHSAAHNENPEIVKLVLDTGADIEARDSIGRTPLHDAVWFNKNSEVVKVLLDAGANMKAKTRDGKLSIDLIEEDSPLYETDVYWRLHDARF